MIAAVRRAFRALAETIVPSAAALSEGAWEELEERVEAALALRPPGLRRQLRLLILALEWAPLLRRGRRFSSLPPAGRHRFLDRIQGSATLLLRRGFWGLRTLVLLGYYGSPEVRRAIGYRASPAGWVARIGPASSDGGSAIGEPGGDPVGEDVSR